MPLPEGFSRLVYRGHFRVEEGNDYSGSLLSAEFGGGLSESEVIFPPARVASLRYPNLSRRLMIEVEPDVFQNRLEYIWTFYNNSKANGNEPFLMQSILNDKWFLWKFPDDDLNIELIDTFMGTAGLKVRQASARGVTPDNEDGSFDEEGS